MDIIVTQKELIAYQNICENFADGQIFTANSIGINGTVLSHLYEKQLINRINTKSPFQYQYIDTELTPILPEKSSSNTTNSKADNQWIGKYFELCYVERANNTRVIPDPTQHKSTQGYDFTEEEKQSLYNQAERVNQFIGPGHHAEWIGEHTISATGDVKLDNNELIEIKHVSTGTGTYFNPGFSYCEKYGFSSEYYLNKFQLRETIERLFPNQVVVRYDILNPLEHKDDYKKIDITHPELVKVDEEMRKAICQDLVNYFKTHPDDAHTFFRDMLNKYGAREYKGKRVPEGHADRYIVYNYKTDEVFEKNINSYKNNNLDDITLTGKGFKIGGLRVQVSWKNRIGNNLALYISFTNKED